PAVVIGLFLLWSRQLRVLLSARLWQGLLLWTLVAVPWFALVGSETKGDFIRGFFIKHNKDRFLAAMEGHSGPPFYHIFSLLIGFLPWSIYLIPALWYAYQESKARRNELSAEPTGPAPNGPAGASPSRFLFCWIAVYFVFFSISQTKLPNYILPLYPAAA